METPPDPPEAPAEPVEVPFGLLSSEALQGLLESFVLREGTDYGAREYSLEEKVAHVRTQLERGQARILFDSESNTVTLMLVPA